MKTFTIALLAVVALAAPAEEVDVLTLKNGHVLEGHYNPETHNFFFGGGVVGSVQIDPADIAKQEKKMVTPLAVGAPPAGGGVAAAPATPPPAAAPAPSAPVDPVQARRIAGANSLKRGQLKKDLQSSEDYQKLYEQNIAKNESDEVELPKKLDSLRQRIDRARVDYDNAQSRYTAVQSDYDWWYGHYHYGTYSGASVADARQQRDSAKSKLDDLQRDEARSQKLLDQTSKDEVSNKAKLQSSIDKQARIKADLQALDAADAAGQLWVAKP